MLKIDTYKTYDIIYEDKVFKVVKNEEEQGKSSTEDGARAIIDRLIKQKLSINLPLEVYKGSDLISARITSVNLEDRTCWISFDEKQIWRQREKRNFDTSYEPCYCRTKKNQELKKSMGELKEKRDKINKEIELQIKDLQKQIESPVSIEIFTGKK
jgi:hypothetical protein